MVKGAPEIAHGVLGMFNKSNRVLALPPPHPKHIGNNSVFRGLEWARHGVGFSAAGGLIPPSLLPPAPGAGALGALRGGAGRPGSAA